MRPVTALVTIPLLVRDCGDVSVRHKPGYYAPKPPHSARSEH